MFTVEKLQYKRSERASDVPNQYIDRALSFEIDILEIIGVLGLYHVSVTEKR